MVGLHLWSNTGIEKRTPLLHAIRIGSLNAAKFLLEKGADPTIPEKGKQVY